RSWRGGRSPPRGARAPPPAAPAGPQPASATPLRSCRLLPGDPAEDPVHEPTRLVRRVALGERHGLVDRDLDRYLVLLELLHPDPEHVALERSQTVGRPALRRGADLLVELLRMGHDRFRQLARERIDLALIQRGERLA